MSGEPSATSSLGYVLPELQGHPEALKAANQLAKEAVIQNDWGYFEQSIFPRFMEQVLGKVEKNPKKLERIEQSEQEAFRKMDQAEKTRKGMLGVMLASVLLWAAVRRSDFQSG